MRRSDGEEYKEGVVKTLWNTVAKILQQKYYEECNIIFDPFKDKTFECARTARDAKTKQLQKCPEKRKISANFLLLPRILINSFLIHSKIFVVFNYVN
jgi:hypothetical protein